MKKNYFKSLLQASLLVCTPLVIASCDDVLGDADNPISSHLTVSQAPVNLELHADRPDAATFIRKGIAASGAQLVYSSTNEKVATVDEAGKITAVGEGDCKIIVKATGLDGNGKPTYQEAEDSFAVKVKDYRARIALKEGTKTAVLNSALIKLPTPDPIDLAEVLDVWPKTGLTIQYGKLDANGDFVAFTAADYNTDDVIDDIKAGGKIIPETSYAFSDTSDPEVHHFTTTVIAHIDATKLPDGFEVKSFPDKQTTAAFKIDVREGVAYIEGLDEEDEPIIKSMFYLDNDETGTKPNYTKMSKALADNTKDAYLDGGWYYLDATNTFNHSIRVKGDANIILGSGKTLTMNTDGKSIMDNSTKKNFSLNFFKENKTAVGTINVYTIQDFKAVNFVGGSITAKTLDKIGTVNINGGTFTNLTNIETLNFKDATLGLAKTPGSIAEIGTATINTAGNIFAPMTSIATLNIEKGALTGDLTKIGTATISDGSINGDFSGTTLNVKKGSAKATTSVSSASIKGALNIDGGTVTVTAAATATAITGNVKVNDGTLNVTATANDKFAIVGNVEVAKGTFTATNANYGAVDGTLTGTFQYSTDGKTWKDLTETSTTAPYIQFVAPTAAP